jgi:aryl-alcohol dehydrogenase-like predicted oxidoreductase
MYTVSIFLCSVGLPLLLAVSSFRDGFSKASVSLVRRLQYLAPLTLSGANAAASINSERGTFGERNKCTGQLVRMVNGIRHKRIGFSDIVTSEMGLGTQRWMGDDFNSPQEDECLQMLDYAVSDQGISLIDTAEQYPIPSSPTRPEGSTEQVIGKWLNSFGTTKAKKRSEVVIATKITGGRNVNKKSIREDLLRSLKRLGTDYLDLYLLHWPARYTPQSNWGQSLMYNHMAEPYYKDNAQFVEICEAMGKLHKEGLIRGWGMCNDNCFGLTASHYISKSLNLEPPVVLQNDYSLINRRIEENGVSEASSQVHLNTGFMAYNVLAGGMLTGKYANNPPATVDNPSLASSMITRTKPRGRMDEINWGRTLYRYRVGAAKEAIGKYIHLTKQFSQQIPNLDVMSMALQWGRTREAVTTQLVGAANMNQLKRQVEIFRNNEENLPYELLWEIDRIHMAHRNPIWSNDNIPKDAYNQGQIGESIP